MLEIHCSGSPHEIGLQHGSTAKSRVGGSLGFYRSLFMTTCKLSWPQVCEEAARYTEPLKQLCPRYLDEMQGVADGAGVELVDIVAINVRTEIMFHLFTESPAVDVKMDGCTSLAIKDSSCGKSFLAQNWDWHKEQMSNLVICHVSQPGYDAPKFSMVTEAGVIGKIGLNANGVGTCLNAIRARGVDPSKLPVHLALRTVLESPSRQSAIERLHKTGVAGSAHILVADATGSTGLECTSKGILELHMDSQSRVIHSNHFLLQHAGVDEPPWLADSPQRVPRMQALVDEKLMSAPVTLPGLFELFKDEVCYPGAINRCQVGGSDAQTLFNIVMDLTDKKATVTFGRPTTFTERVDLAM